MKTAINNKIQSILSRKNWKCQQFKKLFCSRDDEECEGETSRRRRSFFSPINFSKVESDILFVASLFNKLNEKSRRSFVPDGPLSSLDILNSFYLRFFVTVVREDVQCWRNIIMRHKYSQRFPFMATICWSQRWLFISLNWFSLSFQEVLQT